MRSDKKNKLALRKETLRSISSRDLGAVGGGTLAVVAGPAPGEAAGFIMKDSIIVRTSGR